MDAVTVVMEKIVVLYGRISQGIFGGPSEAKMTPAGTERSAIVSAKRRSCITAGNIPTGSKKKVAFGTATWRTGRSEHRRIKEK